MQVQKVFTLAAQEERCEITVISLLPPQLCHFLCPDLSLIYFGVFEQTTITLDSCSLIAEHHIAFQFWGTLVGKNCLFLRQLRLA